MDKYIENSLIEDSLREIYQGWLADLASTRWVSSGSISAAECEHLGIELITGIMVSISNKGLVASVHKTLADISRRGVQAGLTPTETSSFVLSLRTHLPKLRGNNTLEEAQLLLEQAALYTFEVYVESREHLILQQRRDILELSTPVKAMTVPSLTVNLR